MSYLAMQYPLVNGLGELGLFEWLLGKPQSWYDNVNRIQNTLTALMAEVEAIPPDVWNAVWTKKSPGDPFAKRDALKTALLTAFQSIVVTKEHAPTDAEIAAADTLAKTSRAMVDETKRLAPEIAAAVTAEGEAAVNRLANSQLVSPADAGEKAFLESLEKQASLVPKGFGLGLGIGIAALVGLFLLKR